MSTPTMPSVAFSAAREALQAHADDRHREYLQYAGYFDDWTLHVITTPDAAGERVVLLTDAVLTYKGGTRFDAGEIVLASPGLSIHPGTPVTRSAYDPHTGHVCAVPHEHIRAIIEKDES